MVFADTSGFVAAFDAADAAHTAASQAWQAFAKARKKLVTTQLVVAETVTLVRRRAGWEASRRVGEAILKSRAIEVVQLNQEEFLAAWREFVRSGDPKMSLCDATSFIVMRDRGIAEAFTLDHHFRDAGFELIV